MLIAFFLSCLALLNLSRLPSLTKNPRGWLKEQLPILLVGAPIIGLMVYFAMPKLVMPNFLLDLLLWFALQGLIVNGIARMAAGEGMPESMKEFGGELLSRRSRTVVSTGLLIAGVTLGVWALLSFFLGTIYPGVLAVDKLRDLPRVNEAPTSASLAVVDVKTMRQVPKDTAIWKGEKKIGNYGQFFKIGEYDIQEIKNEKGEGHLFWVAPLEFEDFFKWNSSGQQSPGYVKIDAENPSAEAELIDKYKMVYMPSALFNNQLERHVYDRYPDYLQAQATFQVDSSGQPFFVIPLMRPTVGLSGYDIQKVALLDPQNGEIKEYDFGKTPEWVSRVFPEDLALDYNDWFGRYIHGFVNSAIGQKDVHVAKFPGSDTIGVLSEGKFVWVVGHTTPSKQNESLVAYSVMDARTGQITYYQAQGFFNESSVISAVNNAVTNYRGYQAVAPVLYNIYNRIAWVTPIISENGQLQSIAIADAATGRIFPREKVSLQNSTKEDALADFKLWIEGGAAPSGETEKTATVTLTSRQLVLIAGKNTLIFRVLEIPDKTFSYSLDAAEPKDLNLDAVFAEVGQKYTITYKETADKVLQVTKFEK